jgi:Flp pilus assembly protein TadD
MFDILRIRLHQPGAKTPQTRSCAPRLLQAILVTALLTACSTAPLRSPAPPQLISHHEPAAVADVDVLALTPPMREFLERYVLPYDSPRTRLSLLMLAVTDDGVLGFHYNPTQTFTAAEAFRRRSGNCVSFANLFVALARAAGLDAGYQEVFLEPEWSSRQETLLVSKHINVAVEAGGYGYMVDVSNEKVSMDSRRRALSDEQAKAMYFNNLGAEALVRNELPEAYAHFLRAVQTASSIPDTWSNLGVLLARNGQLPDAEQAYLEALRINENELAAMGNLHDLYAQQGRQREAEKLEYRVERYRRENPYYLLQLAEDAMTVGQPATASRLLRRAISLKKDEHLLHYAKARADYLQGELGDAEQSLARARELAPPDLQVAYQRPLAELMWRDLEDPSGNLSR